MQRTENKVTGESRFHGDISCLVVSNFTNHHDIRCLTQNRTQSRSEVQPHIPVNLHLVDAGHLVFKQDPQP